MNFAVKIGHPKSNSVFATFVFVSALFGLFFSNAEGVTLLPFPDSTPEQRSSFEHEGARSTYNQTLTPTRTTPSKRSSSKIAIDDGAGLTALPDLQISRSVVSHSGERFERAPFLYSRNASGNRLSRGPPLA